MIKKNVIVFDANAIGMIAAVRSLGRAGYRVHALSSDRGALGFGSTAASAKAVHPAAASDEFLPWLRDYISRNDIRAMVCSEDVLSAIHRNIDEFSKLIPDCPSADAIKLCLSKSLVHERFDISCHTNKHLPESGIIRSASEIASPAATRNEPDNVYYLKMDRSHGIATGSSSFVVRVNGDAEFVSMATDLLTKYSRLSWQRHVPGLQLGVSFWRHKGRIVAENMVLGEHMYPFRAGSMSLRSSWWHDAILADAKLKLDALNWSGIGMFEYKWDPATDEFWFIEFNPRVWAYMHLDLACAKDFPRWQMDAHCGVSCVESLGKTSKSVVMRYGPGDLIHLLSKLAARDVSVKGKILTSWKYLSDSFDTRVLADLWFPGDRLLFFRSWYRFLLSVPTKILKNLRNSTYVGTRP